MNSQIVDTNYLRTPGQELLLRAALLPGPDALESWEQWQSTTALDDAPPGSYRLLPLIARNLERGGTEYADLGRLNGVRRRTWLQNQLLSRAAADVLTVLRDAGIESMLLRGVGLVTDYYRDPGLRPMRNADILVPEGKMGRAAKLLQDAGWKAMHGALSAFTPGFRRLHSSIAFHRSDLEIRIHWHVLSCCPSVSADQWFWSASEATQFHGVETRTLNVSDQFLCACLASLKWTYEPPFWRIADVLTILRISPKLDTHRVLDFAADHHLELLLRRALENMEGGFGTPIPEVLLRGLAASPNSRNDRLELEFWTQSYRQRTPLAWIAGAYRQSRRSGQGTFAGHVWRSLRWAVIPHLASRYSNRLSALTPTLRKPSQHRS